MEDEIQLYENDHIENFQEDVAKDENALLVSIEKYRNPTSCPSCPPWERWVTGWYICTYLCICTYRRPNNKITPDKQISCIIIVLECDDGSVCITNFEK